jgi:hypothetical protein
LRPNGAPEQMEWKYWQARPDHSGPRSFVMTRGSQILAHAAAIPGVCLAGGQTIRTLHLIDWAARPGAMGAGVALMKHLGQLTDALFAVGGSLDTLRLLPHLGFQRWGDATGYVRPLHPLRIINGTPLRRRTLVPRIARSLWWRMRAPSISVDGWKVRRIAATDTAAVAKVLPIPTNGLALFERRDDIFKYFLDCTIASMQFHVLERDARVRGYFLLSHAFEQVRLADCWIDSAAPADWRALIQCAVLEAGRNRRAAELAAWGSDPDMSRYLVECGFHGRGAVPIHVAAPRHPSLHQTTVRVQMLDNDAAYRHSGHAELWA